MENSVIQPYCQAEYGGIAQECKAASDRLDRIFPAPLSASLNANIQVPRRQADAATAAEQPAAAAQPAAARRQASEQHSATVEGRAAEAPAPRMQPQRRRIRGLGGTSSTESASPPDFPGAPVLDDDDADRQAETAVKTEADLQEDAALAASLNTALPCGHEDEGEVAATQMDEAEEEDEEEGEEEEYQQDEEEEEVAPRQAQGPSSSRRSGRPRRGHWTVPRVTGPCASPCIQGGDCVSSSCSNSVCPPSLPHPPCLHDPPGGVHLLLSLPLLLLRWSDHSGAFLSGTVPCVS